VASGWPDEGCGCLPGPRHRRRGNCWRIARVAVANGKWQLRAPKSLHRRLAERAAREGVSLDTLAVALPAEGLGHRGVRGD
jgi:hypothetical protein